MSSSESSLPTPARLGGRDAASTPFWRIGALAALAWILGGAITLEWPNRQIGFVEWGFTQELGLGFVVLGGALALAALPLGIVLPLRRRVQAAGPWLIALGVAVTLWELLTAKLAVLPAPFFAPPQSLIDVYTSDWRRLGDSLLNSLWLLVNGFVIGAVSGFLTGIAIGWSQALGYWVHPVLRFLGPVPSTALLPMAFFFFPSGWAAAVFLIALATWFPVTVLTWSGVASVDKAFYDVARTMGARPWFLIMRVAVPAALPHVFVGLFMGLGASFSVLVAAEMMGVKSGLGWYLSWAQGWASYANMYGALIIMALVFSGLITLLFRVRDHFLAWQKGVVKW
ncbi:ABC transporter permease [Pollutimonas bauzanensis]|uniref:NitT/TauT family transport system permease protein n=1 Tax=Pollutimonas bauzanensis TaxID=658167 RepID=A0A1M5V8P0_9BURK|nr:ABC transporter permease subunit [Pollutimonas bauzanensis]SHH71632.1 NitT/TauT family transport system permease protein [Pollutimonas bauzanensis]